MYQDMISETVLAMGAVQQFSEAMLEYIDLCVDQAASTAEDMTSIFLAAAEEAHQGEHFSSDESADILMDNVINDFEFHLDEDEDDEPAWPWNVVGML